MNLRKNERLAEVEAKLDRLEKFMPIVEGCLVTLSEWLHVNQQFVLKLQAQAKTQELQTEVKVEEAAKSTTGDNLEGSDVKTVQA